LSSTGGLGGLGNFNLSSLGGLIGGLGEFGNFDLGSMGGILMSKRDVSVGSSQKNCYCKEDGCNGNNIEG